jgi:hypothetical protein
MFVDTSENISRSTRLIFKEVVIDVVFLYDNGLNPKGCEVVLIVTGRKLGLDDVGGGLAIRPEKPAELVDVVRSNGIRHGALESRCAGVRS